MRSLKASNPKHSLIVFTKAAESRVISLFKFAKKADPDREGIVFGTKKRGCNGNSYTMRYITRYESKDNLERVDKPENPAIYVDKKSILALIGTTIGYEDNDVFAGFTFTNPNSKGMCGCGESFSL